MNYPKVKKNVYYDPPDEYPHSSRNHAEDLAEFLVPLGQMHNAAIHDRGIAAGLEVSGAANAATVAIHPGVAVDGAGQAIVLATDGHGDIGDNPPLGSSNEVTVPVQLSLAPQANKTVYVTIQFSEILRFNEGSGGRREQVPWLRLQPVSGAGAYVDDGASVILAIAVIGANGTLTALKASDGAVDFRRRSLGQTVEELRVRRSYKSGDELKETVAASLTSGTGGGLHIGVAKAGDAIVLARDNGDPCARVETRAGAVVCKDSAGREVVRIDANEARLRVGVQGNEGDLIVNDQKGNPALNFNGSLAALHIGTNDNGGEVYVKDSANETGVKLSGPDSRVSTNNLNPIGVRDGIDVNARFFRVHAWDLVLDGRSGGNKRALVDRDNELVVNFAGDYGQGVKVGSNLSVDGMLRAKGDILMSNPARKARWVRLFAKSHQNVVQDVDLGSPRQFIAFVSSVALDSISDFDTDNCVVVDVYKVDGVKTNKWVHGGDHYGSDGSNGNVYAPVVKGVGQVIKFRARCFGPDANFAAFGIVFYE